MHLLMKYTTFIAAPYIVINLSLLLLHDVGRDVKMGFNP